MEKQANLFLKISVATSHGLAFLPVLFKWRGSVYKLLWKELICYLLIYFAFHLLYEYGLNERGRQVFEHIVAYAASYTATIPLSFVLGFFVTNVMSRWWDQYMMIPWPTSVSVYLSSVLNGYDEMGRAMRRTIVRYVVLSETMVLRILSPRVRKRFPKMSDMVSAGLVNESELKIIEDLDRNYPNLCKNFLPIVWAASIVSRARKEGRIRDDFMVKTIIETLNDFRFKCQNLIIYNTICIPLVYTQVVTIAVYAYFVSSLLGNQFSASKQGQLVGINFDTIPVMITLQFIFFMGWLKVAETMMNPFGEDDDDFEVNGMIDNNLQLAYLIVDEMHHDHPELLKDQYWDEGVPTTLPDLGRTSSFVATPSNPTDFVDFDVKVQWSSVFHRRVTTTVTSPEQQDNDDGLENVELGYARVSHKSFIFISIIKKNHLSEPGDQLTSTQI